MIASHRDRSARKTRWLLYIPPAVTCAYRSEWRRQRSYILYAFFLFARNLSVGLPVCVLNIAPLQSKIETKGHDNQLSAFT